MPKQPCVYILASRRNGTIYVGVTADLLARLYKHREGLTRGFAAEHDVYRLVYYEMHDTMADAIAREKRLKNWRRGWKVALIEGSNPLWADRALELGFDPVAPHPSTLTPSSRA
ncbi:MAG TPA: GIY-YIG nuclease family protein [Allosphingosinicella sp.]|jgi:putative endonuclease